MKKVLALNRTLITTIVISWIAAGCTDSEPYSIELDQELNLSQLSDDKVTHSVGQSEIIFKNNEVLINHTDIDNVERSFYFKLEDEQNYEIVSLEKSELVFTSHSLLIRNIQNSTYYSFSIPNTRNLKEGNVREMVVDDSSVINAFNTTTFSQFNRNWLISENLDEYRSLEDYYDSEILGLDRGFIGDCVGGGCGSTACNSGTTVIAIATSCSVTCGEGYYSCCTNDARCFCEPIAGSACESGGGGGNTGGGSGGGSSEQCYYVIKPFPNGMGGYVFLVIQICT